METLRKFIAMIFFVYVILITGVCLWLGFSLSSANTKSQLELNQVKERYAMMEKKLQDDNLRIAEQIGGSQKDRDTAKAEYQNSLSRLERLTAENDMIKKELDSVKTERDKIRTEKTNLEVKVQSNIDPLIQQARDESRAAFEKEKLKLARELVDVRELFQKAQSERDNMNIEFQRLKSENSALNNEKVALEKKVTIYDKQLKSETQEKSKLNDELKEVREAGVSYSKDNASLIAANTKLQQQIKDVNKELSSLKMLLADSKEQATKLSREKESLDIQFNAEKSEKSKYYDESRKYRELSEKVTRDLSAEKDMTRKLSDELSVEKTEKSKKINELVKESEDLKSKNKILSEDLRKANIDKEDNLIKWKSATDKITFLGKDISRLEDNNKLLEVKYEAREKELQKVETDAQKVKKDLVKLEQENAANLEMLNIIKLSESRIKDQLANSQKSARETESRLRTELGKSGDQIAGLANENNVLQDSLTKAKSDMQLLTNNLKSEQAEKYKYYEECKQQSAKNTELQRQVETSNLKAQSSEEEKRLSAERLKEIQVQADTLLKENGDLKTQVLALGVKAAQLKVELESSEKEYRAISETVVAYLETETRLKEQLAKNDEQIVILNNAARKLNTTREVQDKQLKDLSEQLTGLANANKKLTSKVEVQDNQIRDKDEQLMVVAKDNKDYKDRVGSLEKYLAKIEDESRVKITELSDKLRSEISKYDDTASRLRFAADKVSSLERDIKRYEETNKYLEAKYESIDKDFRASEVEKQKAFMDLKSANDKVNLLQKDKEYLTVSLKTAVDERDKAKEDKSKNEMSLATLTKENNSLKDKNDQLFKDSSTLQSKIKTQEYELNTALKKEQDAYQVALNELNSAKETLRSNQWQISELQTKNTTLDKTVASLQTQLKNQESDLQATVKQERDMKNSYLVRLEESETKVNNYIKIEMDLRQKNSTLEKEMAGLKVTMDDKITEAMKQKETDYVNRLREANERVKMMEETLTKERANFYYNLASYATRSQLFEEALDYYNKSLVLNPKDAATYYNMGVLYDEHLDKPSKAIFSYTKYLELAPADVSDREKVKKWIDNLEKRLKDSKDSLIK